MALVGGGNPANPVGIGQALNYIGNHAYAYSGVVTDGGSGSAATTILKFTTGNAYVVAKLTITNDEVGGAQIYLRADINGQQVLRSNSDSAASSAPFVDNPLHLLLEPQSTFELKVGSSTSVDFTAMMVGEVYA